MDVQPSGPPSLAVIETRRRMQAKTIALEKPARYRLLDSWRHETSPVCRESFYKYWRHSPIRDPARLATHEMSHAVVATLLLRKCLHATIENGNPHCIFGRPGGSRDDVLADIVIRMAGRAGEIIKYGDSGNNESDLNQARNAALLVAVNERSVEPLLEGAEWEASELLRAHWPKVEALAAELLRKGTLSEAEIKAVIGPHSDDADDADDAEESAELEPSNTKNTSSPETTTVTFDNAGVVYRNDGYVIRA